MWYDWSFHTSFLLCFGFVLWGQISETLDERAVECFLEKALLEQTSAVREAWAERQGAKGGAWTCPDTEEQCVGGLKVKASQNI